MKTSFSTLGCPEWTLEQIAQNAKAYGYDGVELRTHTDGNHFSPDASPDEARRVAQMFVDAGAPVSSIMGYTRFAFTDNAEVQKNQELMRKLIGLAETMKVKAIRTFLGQVPKDSSHEAMIETAGAALKPLAEEAGKRGVTIAIETHDDWRSPKNLLALLKRVGAKKGIAVVYDIFNCFVTGDKWTDTYREIKPHILYCHVKDGYLGLDGKWHYIAFGAGDLPYRDVLKKLKKDGFKGYLSFEWEKKWHPELEAPERVFPHFAHKIKAEWKDA